MICYVTCNIHRTISGNGKTKHRTLNYNGVIEEIDDDESSGILDRIYEKGTVAWLYSLPASVLVGSTGIFPLLIFNRPSGTKLHEAISPSSLRLLLSFSVGGLFGDVFLHLLPEAWMYLDANDHFAASKMGLWIIGGLICFLIIEKIFTINEEMEEESSKKKDAEPVDEKSEKTCNGLVNGVANGHANGVANEHANGLIKRKGTESSGEKSKLIVSSEVEENEADSMTGKKIIGYLNLLANCIDNFTHGLAVAGSFIVSTPVGLCTTLAILLHEIPHEIGDFAILLKAGFSRWEAAKGQVITASGALFGCVFGLIAEGSGDASSWVLPFTSGGFIYIACVTIIPDLVKETDFKESVKQMVAMFVGIGIMGLVSYVH